MIQYVKEYAISLVIFLSIDAVWLMVISKNLYQKQLGYLMAPKVNYLAALLFYLLFIAGLVYFVVHPAVVEKAPLEALLKGAFLGLLCYATYDLTNLAAIKDWPVLITMIDLGWGTFITGITAYLATLLAERLT